MPDKIHSSVCMKDIDWQRYWEKRKIKQELEFCETDALLPIFKKVIRTPAVILEAGCGLGKWVIYFRRYGYSIIGLDGSLYCLKRIKKHDNLVPLIGGDVNHLPLGDNSVDIYVSLGVMEHFENGPKQALEEAHRVLKKGGLIILEVPCLNFIRRVILPFKKIYRAWRKISKSQPENYYFCEYRYSRRELELLLKNSGFEILFTRPKDDLLPSRSIGLWLDSPLVRAKGEEDAKHELNMGGEFLSKVLNFASPWISCACVVCVGKVRK